VSEVFGRALLHERTGLATRFHTGGGSGLIERGDPSSWCMDLVSQAEADIRATERSLGYWRSGSPDLANRFRERFSPRPVC